MRNILSRNPVFYATQVQTERLEEHVKNQLLMLGAALLAWTTTGLGAPIYTVTINNCASVSPAVVSSTPIAQSATETCGIPTLVATATGFAGPGALGVSATVSNDYGLGGAASGSVFAEMRSTFTISGPAGGPASVPVSLNLSLDGFTSTFSCCDGSGWFLNLNTRQFGQGTVRSNLAGTGLLAGIPSAGSILVATTITTPTVMFTVGPAHILEIGLTVAANANRIGNAEIDFAHTLSFPTNGPVFNLPDGYTIDSPDLGIVDNRFGSEGGSSVPEPSTMALTASALAAAGLLRRKRRNSPLQ